MRKEVGSRKLEELNPATCHLDEGEISHHIGTDFSSYFVEMTATSNKQRATSNEQQVTKK